MSPESVKAHFEIFLPQRNKRAGLPYLCGEPAMAFRTALGIRCSINDIVGYAGMTPNCTESRRLQPTAYSEHAVKEQTLRPASQDATNRHSVRIERMMLSAISG